MTPSELQAEVERVRELAAKATKGPWGLFNGKKISVTYYSVIDGSGPNRLCDMFFGGLDDAAFIAVAPDMAALIEKLWAREQARQWRPISEAPDNEVVLMCDKNGNHWTAVGCDLRSDFGCGGPVYFMPLPEPPND